MIFHTKGRVGDEVQYLNCERLYKFIAMSGESTSRSLILIQGLIKSFKSI